VVLMNSSLVPTGQLDSVTWFMAPQRPTGSFTRYTAGSVDHHVISLIIQPTGYVRQCWGTGFRQRIRLGLVDAVGITRGRRQWIRLEDVHQRRDGGSSNFKSASSTPSAIINGTQLWSTRLDGTGVFNAALTDHGGRSTRWPKAELNYQLSDATAHRPVQRGSGIDHRQLWM
jgi:hypothetical protein